MGIFDGAKSITMNNKVVSSITTDTGVLYQKKVNSQLSIDVPLSLTYSDDFNITGYLTSNGVGIIGATVNLLVGSTVVDFTTTTTGGAYSFTNTPVSAGNHSFQVVFNGNSEYFASESSIVNRVVNKETSVLLNATQTGKIGFAQTGTGYNSVTPACILRTDDDEAIAYATIHFGDAIDSTQIDGYAQGNDVTYPTTSVNIVYEGDSNYTSSSVTANFEYQIPTLLNLSGTNIISKDETTTISGVLYDQDGDIIPNCQLEYNIKHNSTIITSGTVRTDNNGAITLNYTGTGAGDVDIIVSYGNLLQETFVVQDCYDNITGQTDELTKFGSSISLRNSGGATLSYDSTNKYYKWSLTKNNSESFIPINNATGLNDFTIEFDAYLQVNSDHSLAGLTTYKDSSNWLRLSNIENKKSYYLMNNGSGSENEVNATDIRHQWVHFKFTITEDTVSKEVYSNDVLVDSASQQLSSSVFTSTTKYGIPTLWGTSWNNSTYLKNFKIKAL